MLVVLNDWVSINPSEVAWMRVIEMSGTNDKSKSAVRWLDIRMKDGRLFQSEVGGDPYFLKKAIERLLKPYHGQGAPPQYASGKPYDATKGPLAEAHRRTARSRARKKAKRA